jgi:hypothetical protein
MTASAQQPAIQAWLDSLKPVERHRVFRLLNWHAVHCHMDFIHEPQSIDNPPSQYEYDVNWLSRVVWDSVVIAYAKAISTAPGGQERDR